MGHNDPNANNGEALDSKNIAFIRYIIENLLPSQPTWVQGIVLFAFVFLFIYLVVFSLHASIVLPATVKVKLSPDEIKARQASMGPEFFVPSDSFSSPPLGYMIGYDNFYYGLNGNGETRLDLSLPIFAAAIITRSLAVTVLAPDGKTSFSKPLKISGLGHAFMFFEPTSTALNQGLGAIDIQPPGKQQSSRLANSGLIERAYADTAQGGRLYLQSVTIANTLDVATVSASLSVRNSSSPLLTLSSDLATQNPTPLVVKSGAAIVQDYRTYFALSQPSVPGGAKIMFQSGLFGLAYNENFILPDEMDIGVPVQITGTAGSIIIVQLAYPFDVVFFEGQKSAPATATLVPKVRARGYAPRINNSASNASGPYNIIYSGTEVPISALRHMVELASQAHVELRYIQPQVKLSNGIQNQIQIGDSSKVACLPSISAPTLTSLVQSTSDKDFLNIIAKLPRPNGCS